MTTTKLPNTVGMLKAAGIGPVPVKEEMRRNLLRKMLSLFAEDSPRMLADIRRAIDERDASALKLASHALKGSVANFAAPTAVAAALALEVMAREGNLGGAERAYQELEDELARFHRDALEDMP